eukprot:Nk52_evm38s914 gene=Nk52_evmTU38s914
MGPGVLARSGANRCYFSVKVVCFVVVLLLCHAQRLDAFWGTDPCTPVRGANGEYLKESNPVAVWLNEIGMSQYCQKFFANGYDSLDVVHNLNEKDMDLLDIRKQGHIKRILLALNSLSLSAVPKEGKQERVLSTQKKFEAYVLSHLETPTLFETLLKAKYCVVNAEEMSKSIARISRIDTLKWCIYELGGFPGSADNDKLLKIAEHFKSTSLGDLMQSYANAESKGGRFSASVAGFFSFVNMIWVFSIFLISVASLAFMSSIFVPLLLPFLRRVFPYFWKLFSLLPPIMYEFMVYIICVLIIVNGHQEYERDVGQYIALTGLCLFAVVFTFSCGMRFTKLQNSASFLFILTLIFGMVGLWFQSSLIGFFASIMLQAAIGFSIKVMPLAISIGFANNSALFRCSISGLFMLCSMTLALVMGGEENVVVKTFGSGFLYMGTLTYFMGLLISSSYYYWRFNRRSSAGYPYWIMQPIVIVSGLMALFTGSVFNIPHLKGSSILKLSLYIFIVSSCGGGSAAKDDGTGSVSNSRTGYQKYPQLCGDFRWCVADGRSTYWPTGPIAVNCSELHVQAEDPGVVGYERELKDPRAQTFRVAFYLPSDRPGVDSRSMKASAELAVRMINENVEDFSLVNLELVTQMDLPFNKSTNELNNALQLTNQGNISALMCAHDVEVCRAIALAGELRSIIQIGFEIDDTALLSGKYSYFLNFDATGKYGKIPMYLGSLLSYFGWNRVIIVHECHIELPMQLKQSFSHFGIRTELELTMCSDGDADVANTVVETIQSSMMSVMVLFGNVESVILKALEVGLLQPPFYWIASGETAIASVESAVATYMSVYGVKSLNLNSTLAIGIRSPLINSNLTSSLGMMMYDAFISARSSGHCPFCETPFFDCNGNIVFNNSAADIFDSIYFLAHSIQKTLSETNSSSLIQSSDLGKYYPKVDFEGTRFNITFSAKGYLETQAEILSVEAHSHNSIIERKFGRFKSTPFGIINNTIGNLEKYSLYLHSKVNLGPYAYDFDKYLYYSNSNSPPPVACKCVNGRCSGSTGECVCNPPWKYTGSECDEIQYIEWDSGLGICTVAVFIGVLIGCFIFLVVGTYFRKSPIMIMTSLSFSAVVLFALYIRATSLITFLGYLNERMCAMRIYFVFVSVHLLFGAICIKTAKLHIAVRKIGRKFNLLCTSKDCFYLVAVIVSLDTVFGALMYLQDYTSVTSSFVSENSVQQRCTYDIVSFPWIGFVSLTGALFIASTLLSVSCSSLKSRTYTECGYSGIFIYCLVVASFFDIFLAAHVESTSRSFILSSNILVTLLTFLACGIIFVPRCVYLLALKKYNSFELYILTKSEKHSACIANDLQTTRASVTAEASDIATNFPLRLNIARNAWPYAVYCEENINGYVRLFLEKVS